MYNMIIELEEDIVSKENYDIYAKPIERFVADVILRRTIKKYPFDKTIIMRSNNRHEEHALKCDFFLMKNNKDWIAFDAKSPKGIDSSAIDWDNHWICPFDSYGNKRDVSLEVKIEDPDVVDRFLAFCEKDSIVLVSSTALAKWLSSNVWPDFHAWNDDRAAFKDLMMHADELAPKDKPKRYTLSRTKNLGLEKILTSISSDELRSIGNTIYLDEYEEEEWTYVLKEIQDAKSRKNK